MHFRKFASSSTVVGCTEYFNMLCRTVRMYTTWHEEDPGSSRPNIGQKMSFSAQMNEAEAAVVSLIPCVHATPW